jgi:predicted  nucleic acid-binding Zn-ribbon protein
MVLVLALLAGLIIGGGIVGYVLSQRWQQQVQEAERSLQDIADQYQALEQQKKDDRQRIADLEYQLGEAQKDLRAAQARQS